MAGTDTPDDAAGHRKRLRDRLLGGGAETLQDYELLEYLLMLAIPRIDTKPIAKALLREFGDLGSVLTADADALTRVRGVGENAAAAIKIAQALAVQLLKSHVAGRPMLASWDALLDYLRADMAFDTIERVRVLHLSARNELIHDEVMSEGSVDQAHLHVREVMKRAMELGSSSIILVHNHPSGDPSPSRADIALTREIIAAGRPLNIGVHDHVIIARTGHASLRALGVI